MLINVKLPKIVGILTFMSMKKSCIVKLRMKKNFIASGPGFNRDKGQFYDVMYGILTAPV